MKPAKPAAPKSQLGSRKLASAAGPIDALKPRGRSTAMTPAVALAKESTGVQWTFLTNHAHVLVLLSRNPSLVLREVALQVQRIIADLEAGGVIEREKIGRQNHYRIRTHPPLRHPIESHRTIGDLLALFGEARA